jgi:4-hydroxymandelate oxidase
MAIDLFTLREQAEAKLAHAAFEYADSGSSDERTLAANVRAWEQIGVRPRVLRDVSAVDTSTTVLGQRVALPVLLAPTAMHTLFWPDGERSTAAGSVQADTIMAVSMTAATSIEAIAAVPGVRTWMHVTMHRDRGRSRELCQRAHAAGCGAIVLTVDAAIATRRPRTERTGLAMSPDMEMPNIARRGERGSLLALAADFDRNVTFDDIALVSEWAGGLPVVIKGVVRGDDAALCVDAGAAAIAVSNHGGRELDQTVATAYAVPDVVDGVQGRAEVYVDGGIRRGVHVLAALAMGATATLIGRSAVFGLAIDGAAGVAGVLEQFRSELEVAMTLCGARDVSEVTRDLVVLPS